MNLKQWLKSSVFMHKVAPCMCEVEVCGLNAQEQNGEYSCNWVDKDGFTWMINVLDDGTAITWCTDL